MKLARRWSLVPSWRDRFMDLLEDFFAPFEVEPWREAEGSVNVYEEDKDLVVEVKLPGFDKNEIEVTVSDDAITVKAEKKHEETKKDRNYFTREFSYASVYRTIPLPKEIKANEAKATYEGGILKIRAPKLEERESEGVKIKIE